MLDRYRACMVLHGVGDSIGYKGGSWEFCTSGERIYEELCELGGINALALEPKKWPVSDDTVLHLSVAECLVENKDLEPGPQLYTHLVKHYKNGMKDMVGRAPGNTTKDAVYSLSFANPQGYRIPFNPRGAGCGASMRSSCIGLRYPKPEQLDSLIQFSIESGRMTHHLPIGYLGGLVAALFTTYALQDEEALRVLYRLKFEDFYIIGKKVENWGVDMLEVLPRALEYIKKDGFHAKENKETWPAFERDWKEYLTLRNIDKPDSEPTFPEKFGIAERDVFYKEIAKKRWPGALGVDSVIIAYDALLGAKDNWEELMLRSAIHCGDSDSTACIAASWYGTLYGFKDVPNKTYEKLEYLNRLIKCADGLYTIASS